MSAPVTTRCRTCRTPVVPGHTPALIRDCTAREFLDLIAEPAQASLFAEARAA